MNEMSVLIPFYKGNSYINQTLSSVEIALKGIDYEIIIINDSPDTEIQLDKEYSRLKIVNNDENVGIAESRNRAYKQSNGKYILFLDQDDLVASDKNFIDLLRLGKKLYIFNFSEFIDGKEYVYYGKNAKKILHKINESVLLKCGPFFRTVSQFLFSRELFEVFISSKAQGADDFFFYCDLYKNTKVCERLYISEPQILYRIHKANYSKKADFYASLNEIFYIWNKRNNEKYSGLEKYYFNKSFFWRLIHKIVISYIKR